MINYGFFVPKMSYVYLCNKNGNECNELECNRFSSLENADNYLINKYMAHEHVAKSSMIEINKSIPERLVPYYLEYKLYMLSRPTIKVKEVH